MAIHTDTGYLCARLALLVVFACTLLGACSQPDAPQAAVERPTVGEELARLQGLIDAAEIEGDTWPGLKDRLQTQLDAIAAISDSGRELLALHELSDPRNTLLAYLYAAGQDAPGEFNAAWTAERSKLADIPTVNTATSAGLRALAEASRARMRPYHSASRSFAAATSDESGLFYLGRARAFADYVDFCNRMAPAAHDADPPSVRSIASELDDLEERILAVYQPPLSIDRHGDFIGLHATLKLARELDAEGAYFGAVYQYVDATIRLNLIKATSVKPEPAALLAQADAIEDAWGKQSIDHGIGKLFVEQAREALEATGEDAADVANVIRAHAALAVGVPAYLRAVEPSTEQPDGAPAPVTVTLVRWPYT